MQRTKRATVALVAGALLAFGGCLSVNPRELVLSAATQSVIAFVTDNDAIFDLFEDGGIAAQ